MGYGTSNIERVRAVGFPAGGLSGGAGAYWPGPMLVSWKSGEKGKLFQVYVNGRWAGVTGHELQRQLLVSYEDNHPALIEVIWVTPADKEADFSGQLEGFREADGSHARITFVRRGNVVLESRAELYGNGGSGEIDYGEPMVRERIWQDEWDKWGFGLEGFGLGDWGWSGSGSFGWGRGVFGGGEFGFDADEMSFETGELKQGTYEFALRVTDGRGNYEAGQDEQVTVGIDPIPAAAEVQIVSYEEEADRLVINITGD